MPNRRKYSATFLQLGFIENDSRPQCLLCGKLLSNECMKRSKLLRHLKSQDPSDVGKPLDFIKERELVLQRSFQAQPSEHVNISSSESPIESAKMGRRSFNIAVSLVQDCIEDTVSTLFGPSGLEKIEGIPASRQTITRRIAAIGADLKGQLLEITHRSPYFAVQFDESTECASIALLICFIRLVDGEKICVDMLFCAPLRGRATSEDLLDTFENATVGMELTWHKCVGICGIEATCLDDYSRCAKRFACSCLSTNNRTWRKLWRTTKQWRA